MGCRFGFLWQLLALCREEGTAKVGDLKTGTGLSSDHGCLYKGKGFTCPICRQFPGTKPQSNVHFWKELLVFQAPPVFAIPTSTTKRLSHRATKRLSPIERLSDSPIERLSSLPWFSKQSHGQKKSSRFEHQL